MIYLYRTIYLYILRAYVHTYVFTKQTGKKTHFNLKTITKTIVG